MDKYKTANTGAKRFFTVMRIVHYGKNAGKNGL
jgi:hypothetical protein